MVHRDNTGFRIAVMDLGTRHLRLLTKGPLDESPSFAPNGAVLIYAGTKGSSSVLSTASLHGDMDIPLKFFDTAVQEPSWSP